jgi:hypothetical protein
MAMTKAQKARLTLFVVYRRVVSRWVYWTKARGRDKEKLVDWLSRHVGEDNLLVLEADEIQSDRRCVGCGHPDTDANPVRTEADECEQCCDRRTDLARLGIY